MIEINFKQISRLIGKLLLFESIMILSTIIISAIYAENDALYFIISAAIALLFGALLILLGKNAPLRIGKREGAIIVTFSWLLFSLFGSLPYWLSGAIPDITNAFFESISGFTTTGASILNNIEELSHGVLFWRSMTHWLGGLGIVVISMAILPTGTNDTQLFVAETTGPIMDKISPKINDNAKILLIIYVSLTLLETIFLLFGGMSLFDALCHSLATIATGGFSTKQASIGHWDSPYIQYVISVFMLLSGVNFAMYFLSYVRNFKKVKQNEELKGYFVIVLLSTLFIVIARLDSQHMSLWGIEKIFREVIFTVAAIITTTGFATVDYLDWQPITWVIIGILMFIGGSAGSTGGGSKVVRSLIVLKAAYYDFKRLIHPTAIIPVKFNNLNLSEDTLTRVFAFLFIYFIIIVIGTIILLGVGLPIPEAFGGMLSSLSCVGPAFGELGPAGNYANLPIFAKWFLSAVMLVGRLELFTVLVIFTPVFWKK